jgi:superfamily II DNA or RNA helicase
VFEVPVDGLTKGKAKNLIKGRKALIVTEHVKTTEFLKELFDVDVLHGQVSGKDFKNRFETCKSNKVDALVVTSIFDVGIDIPDIDTIIHYGHYDSLPRLIQRNGRAMRPFPGKEVRIYHNIGNRKDSASYTRMKGSVYKQCPKTYSFEE